MTSHIYGRIYAIFICHIYDCSVWALLLSPYIVYCGGQNATPAAFFDMFSSRGRSFSSRGRTPATPPPWEEGNQPTLAKEMWTAEYKYSWSKMETTAQFRAVLIQVVCGMFHLKRQGTSQVTYYNCLADSFTEMLNFRVYA